jgi:release factor glutamine methyltransferase
MDKEKPLLRKNVLDYEPSSALFVPDDDPLVFYRAIARWSEKLLTHEGMGLTEINEVLGPQTEGLFKGSGFPSTEMIKDFYDKNRFVIYKR